MHHRVHHVMSFFHSIIHSFNSIQFNSIQFTSLHFTSLHLTSLHFTSPHFTSLQFTSLHFTSLHFTSPHFTSLQFTSLQFISLHFNSIHSFIHLAPSLGSKIGTHVRHTPIRSPGQHVVRVLHDWKGVIEVPLQMGFLQLKLLDLSPQILWTRLHALS